MERDKIDIKLSYKNYIRINVKYRKFIKYFAIIITTFEQIEQIKIIRRIIDYFSYFERNIAICLLYFR